MRDRGRPDLTSPEARSGWEPRTFNPAMFQLADNIPGKPHRWAPAIAAWAHGRLVQWRYKHPEANDLDWRDCDYPSRGRPNFEHPDIEFRVAPDALQPPAWTS